MNKIVTLLNKGKSKSTDVPSEPFFRDDSTHLEKGKSKVGTLSGGGRGG